MLIGFGRFDIVPTEIENKRCHIDRNSTLNGVYTQMFFMTVAREKQNIYLNPESSRFYKIPYFNV